MRNIIIGIFCLLLVSCSETKMLQSSLLKLNSSVEYLHDSPETSCFKPKQVYVNIDNAPIDTITTVSKLNGLLIPLIVFDYYNIEMKVKLGQSSIQENYNNFFFNSIAEESKRSGCFNVTDEKTNDSIYSLDLKIDSCNTISKYRKSFIFMYLFFAYSYSYSESGSPAETNLQVSAKLRKGDSLIYEKKYIVKRNQPFVPQPGMNSNKLRADFTTNMVEGLSLSTKNCIEQIVDDVNTSIHGSKGSVIQIDETLKTDNQQQEVITIPVEKKTSAINNEVATDQLERGDSVTFYNFGTNTYLKGVVKDIKADTLIIEYESFGKTKTTEVNKSDIKRL
ncbi:MAG: hypothetical protein PHR83_19040 [Paludibacter sp.]|nr:hypothetical protein [Paludibacter sp.]